MRQVKLGLVLAAGIAVATLASACGSIDKSSGAEPASGSPSSSGKSSSAPAHDNGPKSSPSTDAKGAGGICKYLDFASLREATGQPFSVADSGGQDEVTDCVIMTTEGSFPDVTLTKAKTASDTKTYKEKIPPEKNDKVDDLGKTAYSAVLKPVKGGGPVVEIGWLTKGHLYSLRYTTIEGTDKDKAKGAVKGLIAVARSVDKLAGDGKD
ncbi:MAG TPA: hypothetical protein VE172_23785 [Stackebrandtia sp.]|jgi:hypothetical protein|uniref:hypothetical protein n=1 Tax=Stackebrandtia sp. TaxID=2023065 RepID=UPI002D3ECFBF|nr:hypothetical protein [Stackebrandtia sp.]HZE41831.1 hypothetical protein [Stackebrandtia sp.]